MEVGKSFKVGGYLVERTAGGYTVTHGPDGALQVAAGRSQAEARYTVVKLVEERRAAQRKGMRRAAQTGA